LVFLFFYNNCSGYEAGKTLDLGSTTSADASAQVKLILTNNCATCHGPANGVVGGFADVTDLSGLISQNQIIPNNANNSVLFQSLTGANGTTLMPVGMALNSSDIQVIRDWINQGALFSTPVLGPTFSSINANILKPKCVACHNAVQAQGGIRLDSYTEVIKYVNAPAQADTSALYTSVLLGQMPLPPQAALSDSEIVTILNWIKNQALDN
jgi:mono/diheme cytochrome c family protein